ncbi:MAG: hypothetical protein ACP8RL_01325 [cyanobacterium endosymbiont of Rhopalodia inflata]
MFFKQSHLLAGLAVAAMSALSIVPVQAEPTKGEILISQLRGHELEDPIEVYQQDWVKFKFEDYAIGRIRGVTGDVAQIQTISPPYVKIGDDEVWRITTRLPKRWPTLVAGSDVIMKIVDNKWVILSEDVEEFELLYDYAMPAWVSRLDLREVALIERTDIDWDRPDVSLPPLAPNTEVEMDPIRGMW